LLGIFNSLVDDMVFLPIVALTADQSSVTRKRALAAGAMDFLTKPFNEEEILLRTRNLLHSRYLFRVTQGHSADLDRRVSERTHELEQAEMEVIERLAAVCEFRDDETGQHTKRVGELAMQIGLKLGLSKEGARRLGLAAQLHDIGNAGIADTV